MPVLAFDHCSLPTDDSERFIAFYKRLGFEIIGEEQWRQGKNRIFSVRVGENNMINVHPGGWRPPAHLRGRTAAPGCGDICFHWEGTVEEVLAMVKKAGVPVTHGPVTTAGARRGRTLPSTSVYVTDPDGNLLEFLVYGKA